MAREKDPDGLLNSLREFWLEPILMAPIPDDLRAKAEQLQSSLGTTDQAHEDDPGADQSEGGSTGS